MSSLIGLLKGRSINALELPDNLQKKVNDGNIQTLWDLFSFLQKVKAYPENTNTDMSNEDIKSLDKTLKDYLAANQTDQTSNSTTPESAPTGSRSPLPPKKSTTTKYQGILTRDLLEKELYYSPQLRGVELVGEIPISKDELSLLAHLFRDAFSQHSAKEVLEAIEKLAPASFVIFLVGQGVYGYNGGDYWSSVEEALGCKTGFVFGQTFERIIRRHRLASFEELQKKSTRYVSLILAHGGVPVYSLDDYFSNYVLTSIHRPQYMGLDGEEALNALLSSSVVTTTDKPVTHFFEYGGKVALDIYNRSRRLLLQWQPGQTIPSIEETGLPRHMVEHFVNWAKTKQPVITPIRNNRNRLQRPEFCLDPWGLGIFLKLPSQSVPVLDAADCRWIIQTESNTQEVAIEIDSQGYTREITIRMDMVSDAYTVKFVQGNAEFEWIFDAQNSIYVFDPNQGTFSPRLTNNEVWIIYPQQMELIITEGDGYQTEELPSLPGNWTSLKAEGWELTNAREITFFKQGIPLKVYEIKQQEWIQPPFLSGGARLQTNLAGNDALFVGSPPRIRIPVLDGIDLQDLLERWRISIKPIGFADPENACQIRLSELPNTALSISNYGIDILLEHENLLNTRPSGVFQLIMWGPLGQDVTYKISCWPECDISGINELYIPDRQGALPIQVEVHTGLLDQLETLDGKNDLNIRNAQPGLFSVTVPPEKSRVNMQIVRDVREGTLSVPLEFRVRRLRWQLVSQDMIDTWSDDLLEVGTELFVQMKSPLLIVSIPGLNSESVDLYLRLLDLNSNELLRVEPARRNEKHSGDFWRFDLNVLQSNLRESRAPILRLELVARGIVQDDLIQLPVISFTRSINVQDISMNLQEDDSKYVLDLRWHEQYPLQNRCVYLWSLWRPWTPVVRIEIPDNAHNQHIFNLNKDGFSGGEYRLGFAIVDPWVNAIPPVHPPEAGRLGTFELEVASEQRLAHLEKHAQLFEDHLELILINFAKRNYSDIIRDVRWCISNLAQASGTQVLILKEHLEIQELKPFLEQMGEQVVTNDILSMLLNEVRTGTLTSANVSSILNYAPMISLWSNSVCELLLDFDDRKWRLKALQGLVTKNPELAAKGTLSMIKNGLFDIEDAVELLYENRPQIIEALRIDFPSDPIALKIVEFLQLYNPFSGLPMVRVGTWVRTDAGWGKIESIQDMISHTSVEEFMEGQGVYKLVVHLHIDIDFSLKGERAVIDMKEKTLTFQRAKSTYICDHCREFMSTHRDIYKTHITRIHPGKYPTAPSSQTMFAYTFLEFDHSRK